MVSGVGGRFDLSDEEWERLAPLIPIPELGRTSWHLRVQLTSRRISTARRLGGRNCSAATRASRTLSRSSTIVAGVGKGSSQGTSRVPVATWTPGSSLAAPNPEGSGRRAAPSSERRQVLVAIRYSQVRSDERPANRS